MHVTGMSARTKQFSFSIINSDPARSKAKKRGGILQRKVSKQLSPFFVVVDLIPRSCTLHTLELQHTFSYMAWPFLIFVT